MMGRVTDGQESIPWATSLLLTTQLCQLHNPHPSPAFLHPHHLSFNISFHLYCFTSSCCVTQLTPPRTTSPSINSVYTLLDLPLPLSFSSSISSGRNGLSAKPRPNPLIFLHVVSARAAIPLFLHPLLLCWADGQCSDPRLTATHCKFSS